VPVGLRDPSAAGYLARSIVSATTQLAAIGLATALCIWVAGTRRRTAPVARALLFIAIVLNLFAANRGLNPTMSVSSIGHPSWLPVAHAHPDSRIYSPHPAILPKGDRELPTTLAVHPDMPAPAVTAVYQSTLAGFPTAPGLHSVLAPDLTRLRSVAYTARCSSASRPATTTREIGSCAGSARGTSSQRTRQGTHADLWWRSTASWP